MKHCKSCDKCTLDLVSYYIKDYENYKCAIDGHTIERIWWEKCRKYEKGKNDRFSSLLYEIVQIARGKRRKR